MIETVVTMVLVCGCCLAIGFVLGIKFGGN
jgi:hypothetical protein